ncbi:sugar phosphate isomerase/epimerase [Candidatus Poribacteria bacterium]|nr:sugar phosphate isomerase/epimerase [Candidatus Poribacteria bacterium]
MQFGFMSSVCPPLTMAELIDKAKEYNYEHLELRVEWDHGHGVELDSSQQQLNEARTLLEDNNITLSCIATGVRFIDPDPQKRLDQVDLLKRYIDLTEKMGAQNIRIFGDPVPKTPVEIDQTLDWEADGIRACDGLAGEAGVALCLETHGNLLASYLIETLYRSDAENTYVNWHAAHHVRHGQPVDVAYVHLRNKIRHAHVNFGDDGPMPDTERDSLTLLKEDGYEGFISIEVINPKDSDAVLKRHAELYKTL